ncbi:uncharacterized protein LOC106096050 isoform X4 [Stomoxys calcitrans]|uniref:uncharacterized protein LOC106096050 isoform X4 n=1 Tax=Stomoxys calcitrans TaxID=35570 RepID=UPI0027E2D597|nr:uncharacterized protein LOC106096050 isoform X4 [Stomoxys calcitrans]
MAAPFVAPEDLEKLKKFIDFVASNPLILNVPQMGFLKRFIEKFGGKVPEGEFQMPAGGKCPFGGDAKTETKSCPHPPPPTQSDEDVVEESEESEVELDMEEINVQLLEPNVLYLDEKPPKIVKNIKAPKRGDRSKKMAKKKDISKKTKIKKIKKLKAHNCVIIKKEELPISGYETRAQSRNTTLSSIDDPLCTPEKEIKMENLDHKLEQEEQDGTNHRDSDVKSINPHVFDVDEIKYSENEDTSEGKCETKQEQDDDIMSQEEFLDDDDNGEEEEEEEGDTDKDEAMDSDDDYEDEPLILLTRNRGRPRKDVGRNRLPRLEQCREKCKQQCPTKFTEEQRRSMCDLYWSLSEDERLQYIRKRIKARCVRLQRKRITNRGGNCCYYLDGPSEADECGDSPNLIRVCRKFFETTLCLRDHAIKKALEGYEPESEIEVVKPLLDQQKENIKKTVEKADAVEQFLDPETGDLITIDPKAKKAKKPSSEEPKKKRVRRKPGDPLPEHNPKPIKCQQRCIHKCHTKFTEEERKQICDIFWSMDYKRRKDYILARIETKEIESVTTPEFRKSNRPPRAYHTRFYLGSGLQGENKRVCKHFMMSTLSISRMFITNAIDFADKKTGCYTGADRRGGHNTATTKLKPEYKKLIQDHISSFPTWIPNKKSKTRYLHHTLNIKRMYLEYKDMCNAEQMEIMSISFYYKSFHEDFTLSFLTHPEPKRRGGLTNTNPNISHYTGLEPGGVWLDPKGEKLDLSLHNPAESFISYPRLQPSHTLTTPPPPPPPATIITDTSTGDSISNTAPSTTQSQTQATAVVGQPSTSSFNFNQSLGYAHILDPTTLNTSFICPPTAVRHEFNPNLYDSNLPHAHAASTPSLFRRL